MIKVLLYFWNFSVSICCDIRYFHFIISALPQNKNIHLDSLCQILWTIYDSIRNHNLLFTRKQKQNFSFSVAKTHFWNCMLFESEIYNRTDWTRAERWTIVDRMKMQRITQTSLTHIGYSAVASAVVVATFQLNRTVSFALKLLIEVMWVLCFRFSSFHLFFCVSLFLAIKRCTLLKVKNVIWIFSGFFYFFEYLFERISFLFGREWENYF